MNSVILTIIVLLADHLDKTVMLLGKGICIKETSGQLVVAVNRYKDEVYLRSVIEMILNKSNEKNVVFNFC